jgi:flagellar export protein FliJ
MLMDLADSRSRAALRTAEEQLAVVESTVADVRDTHRQASMERQVLERVRDRRRLEHGSELARQERRSFDAIAARRYH